VLLLAGLFTYFGATFLWYLWPLATRSPLPFPSPLDALFFASYGIFTVFVIQLLRRHRSERVQNRIALTDALVITTAASAVLWIEFIEPQLYNGTPWLDSVVAVLYPVLSLLMFSLAVRAAIILKITCSVPALLLLAWIGTESAFDLFMGVQTANGTFDYGGPLMLILLTSYTALAALAAHPGVESLLVGTAEAEEPAGKTAAVVASAGGRHVRQAALLLAALFPLALHAVYFDNSPSLLVASGITFVLVTYRTSLLAGDLRRQHELADDLYRAAQRLALQRDELARFAAIVASTDDAVITTAPDGRIIDWNRGAVQLYGYRPVEAVGKHVWALIDGDQATGSPRTPRTSRTSPNTAARRSRAWMSVRTDRPCRRR
jgi:two-component system sensor histidine kinase/response regulator